MRTPLDQALHDAQSVSEWMDDNNVGNESVGFATAWAEIQSVIRYLSSAQQSPEADSWNRCPRCHERLFHLGNKVFAVHDCPVAGAEKEVNDG